jgi:hypothetical protein
MLTLNPSRQTLKVPPDVWDALKNKYEDQVGFK